MSIRLDIATIDTSRAPDEALAWDEFVETVAGGDLVQTALWGDTKRELGASVHVLVLRDGARVVGGASIHVRAVAPGLRMASVAKGPVLAPDRSELVGRVCDELQRASLALGARALVVQAPDAGWEVDLYLEHCGFVEGVPAIAPPSTAKLDLSRSDAELLAAMSAMRRRNVRSAVRAEAAEEMKIGFESDVGVFHALHVASAARQGFAPIERRTLDAQWRHLASSGRVASLIARCGGTPVAGLWLTAFGGVVTYKLPGWDPSLAQSKNVNEALHWHAIRWARSMGATTYDFGGFDREAARALAEGLPMPEGFDRTPSYFKAGFGGEVQVLPTARMRLLLPVVGTSLTRVGVSMVSSRYGRTWIGRYRNR